MTPERWQQVKELFRSALEREVPQRAAFLDEACANDLALREEIESLLASHEQAGRFLAGSQVKAVVRVLEENQAQFMVGRRIGPYQIVREIGHGGMGTIYLAVRADDEYEKRVAIKLVRRGMDTEAIIGRFRNERQILANLDHPHIAKLLDGGTTDDGLSYFVMDYVEGLTIDAYCDTHKLSITERLELFRTVCSAVHYAHQHHVIHRDLKPSNILVTAEGVPKLLDFGIAKVLDPELSYETVGTTATALRPMTPEYASPEQVRGQGATPASDVYSLGVLLYELLTGHQPYRVQTRTPQEIERIVCEEEPEKPSRVINCVEEAPPTDGTRMLTPESVSETREDSPGKLRRRLTGDLDNIIAMALRKEPERRYASVAEFSEDLRRHLEGQPVLARQDRLGYRTAKFVKRNKARVSEGVLLVVVLLMLVSVMLYTVSRRDEEMERAIDSIAILPFVNASADPGMEYLSDGITETVINSLSQLPKLRVMARSTVFRYKGRQDDPQKIGRDLNVRAVFIGKVDQRGDTLIINTELVDTASGAQLWGHRYNRKFSDILAVQEDISREISQKLRLKLAVEEKRQLAKRYTENTEAYQFYLKGRYFWNQTTAEGIRKGIEYLEQATAKDPNYALAYAGLADCYTTLGSLDLLPPKESFPGAKAAALRALAIDDQLGEAHDSLAAIKALYEWDFGGAEREFQRAIALNPGYAIAHHWYGNILLAMGREEAAIAEQKRALELDPLSLLINTAGVARTFLFTRQYHQALEQCRKTLEIDPNYYLVHIVLGHIYHQKGMYEEAIAELQKALTLSGRNTRIVALLGHAYALSGHKGEAQRILHELQELSKRRYVSSFFTAMIYVGLGEKDHAFQWLSRACEERDQALIWLKTDPRLHSLRSDPRFVDLLRRVGLPP